MTVKLIGNIGNRYVGLSTDTKPTDKVPEGSTFEELDTGANYAFHDGAWWGRSTDVKIQDQHTELVDLLMINRLSDMTLLANHTINDRSIDIETPGYVPQVHDTVCLKEDTAFYQAIVLAVTPITGNQYTLDLDTPLDFAFTVSGGCSLSNHNLAVDGSVTPVEFAISPIDLRPGTEWDIVRILLVFLGSGYGTPPDDQPDDAGFGAGLAVTNGLVLRSENGIFKNVFNVKTNFQLRARGYDLSYQAKNKDGFYGVAFRRTFGGAEKNGVTIRLEASQPPEESDRIILIVQDDLTNHEHILAVVQGHVVE